MYVTLIVVIFELKGRIRFAQSGGVSSFFYEGKPKKIAGFQLLFLLQVDSYFETPPPTSSLENASGHLNPAARHKY